MKTKKQIIRDFGEIAILVVDIQNDFCDDTGIFAQQGLNIKPAKNIVPRIEKFIEYCRRYNIPIVYTKQIEAENIVPANLKRQVYRGKLKAVCAPNSWGSEFYKLKPINNEYIIEKNTYDAFSNQELKMILNKHRVKTVVVIGINTDICVDTTVRRAFTEGYQIIVIKDLVATMNKNAEKYYLNIFDRFFGDVVDSKDFLSYLAEK